jgi:integrase
MGRPKKQRPTATTIYQGTEGLWHGYVTVGVKPDGRPDRRHRSGKDYKECEAKVRILEDQVAAGNVSAPGRVPTLEQWLTTWHTEVVADLAYQTRRTYGWSVQAYLVPGLGGHRMDKLAARHIEALYRRIAKSETNPHGLSPSSVHTVHRALRAALGEALRRGVISKDPMGAVRSPKLDEDEVTPLEVAEVKQIITVCKRRRNGTRWIVGLSLGLRQGEALALPWIREAKSTRDAPVGLDLDAGVLHVRVKAQRQTYVHGCDDPEKCCAERHRTQPCPTSWVHGCADPAACCAHPGRRKTASLAVTARGCPQRRPGPCRRHPHGCPPLCPPGCTGHARHCPEKRGGITLGDPKSRAGRRRVRVPAPLLVLLREHRDAQTAERKHAGSLWEDHGLVWCQPTGRPIDASRDYQEWREILREAGVRDARVHDGRHTAATMLLLVGVDQRTVMSIMGWSDSRMVQRYQHVVDELLEEAADRIGGLLFGHDTESDCN